MSETEFVEFPGLGTVRIRFRKNTSRISARWKDGVVSVSAPVGMGLDDVMRTVGRFAPRLMAMRKEVAFSEGVMDFEGIAFEIRRQSVRPDKVLATIRMPRAYIEVGESLDIDALEVKRAISGMMCRMAYRVAADLLLPRARRIAMRLKQNPAGWGIMSGHSTLGRCNGYGVIHLSYMLVFLPVELRDYVVCHELAHLAEMSHSRHFHLICNAFCSGREAELERKLRAYRWPVIRR